MLFLLASALAMSAVLGHPSGPISKQMTYEKEHKSIMRSEESAQIMAVEDRSSNLKYVMAIKSSSIWAEIKKRSLTINTAQELNDTVAEKSPDNLSDQELAQLKQACHDGLKCVAVDQLLVLKQVKQPLGDGKVSVRTAITKITQVLTQYTTEYHEDVYQYEAVNDSDDESKVYKSVTTIVEDNKELCRIDLTPATQVSHSKNDKGNAVPAVVVNNNNTVNYNTSKNYNINNGTVNSATIIKEPSDIITVVESPEHKTQTNNSSDPSLVIVIAPQTETADTNANKRNTGYSDHVETENNNVSLENQDENGQTGDTNCDHDIVSAGLNNDMIVKKGYVEDGSLNNGNMLQYNINNGTINKGTISKSDARNGIISVGTVNNGPVNYGTSDTYTNNGKQIATQNYDVQQYLSNIDKMYSTILERLG